MTWSYDPNQTGTKDQIRWIVGDTDKDRQLIADEEIDAVLVRREGSLLLTAIDICDHLEAKFVRRAESRSGDIIADFLTVAGKYRELANRLRKRGAKGFSMVDIAARDADKTQTTFPQPSISLGEFDNSGT